jgi:hypothetical protein
VNLLYERAPAALARLVEATGLDLAELEEWRRLRFRLRVRGSLFEVDLGRERATYRLLEGEEIEIEHEGERLRLEPGGGPRSMPLTPMARAAS